MHDVPPSYPGQPGPGVSAPDRDREDEIDLAQLWGILRAGKWKILGFLLAALAGALFYLFVVQPTYRADALLQLQTEGGGALEGLMQLNELSGGASSPAQAEIFIIQSRTVLGSTVDKLGLDVVANPNYFPIVGEAIAKHRGAGMPAAEAVEPASGGWFSNYAWLPTEIRVTRLVVPRALYGAELTLLALGGNRYLLFGPEGQRLLSGAVGTVASGNTPTGENVKIFVRSLRVSAPPTAFTVVRRPWLPTVEELQQRLSVSELGDNTGVVRISLEGEQPERITRIVNTIAESYLRQNVEARSKQAEKSLEFLNQQLPELRAELEDAEAKLAEYREENQAVALDAEAQALLGQIVATEDKLAQLQLKLTELRQIYTGEHPALQVVQEQMQSLVRKRQQIEDQIGTLPSAQKEILQLRRGVEVSTELYTALLNRAQELRIIEAGTVGNVRIVDSAVEPVRPVAPKAALVLALALVLGGMLGCGYVFLQAALRRGISDPKEIENILGLPVYAVIPFSPWLERHSARARRRDNRAPVLARDQGDEVAVEALRSLRTSLYFARMESGGNVILLTGPAPGVGKSFVSINLAYLLSEVNQSVVVVDADMRKGRLHEVVQGRQREPGLSQVLTGQVSLDDALQGLDDTGVKILTTGQLPPNPSELLMRETFPQVLNELKQRFDVVIIDAPPILAVTDAAIIAASVSGVITFMVVRAGKHPLPELEESVKRMSQNERRVAGVVVNAYKQTHADQAGGYGHYQYEYKARA